MSFLLNPTDIFSIYTLYYPPLFFCVMTHPRPFFTLKHLILLGCFVGASVLFSCRKYLDDIAIGQLEMAPIVLISPDHPTFSGQGYVAKLNPVFGSAGLGLPIRTATIEVWDPSNPSVVGTFFPLTMQYGPHEVTRHFLRSGSFDFQGGRTYEVRVSVGTEVFRSRTRIPQPPLGASVDRIFLATNGFDADDGQIWQAEMSVRDRKGSAEGYLLMLVGRLVLVNSLVDEDDEEENLDTVFLDFYDEQTILYDQGQDGNVLRTLEVELDEFPWETIRDELEEGFVRSFKLELVVLTGSHDLYRYMKFYTSERGDGDGGFGAIFGNESQQLPKGFDDLKPGFFNGYRISRYPVDVEVIIGSSALEE